MRGWLRLISVLLVVATLRHAPTGDAQVTTVLVDDDQRQCPTAPFTAIQAAIDAAGPGTTIDVCPGTYVELLSIGPGRDRLTLQAQLPLAVVVEPPATQAQRDGTALLTVGDARDITIAGLRLTGPVHTGVLVQSDPPAPPTAVPRTAVTLRANRIEGYLTSGVRVTGTGAVTTLEANQIVGQDPTAASGRVGVEVRAGAGATIRDNDIGDNGRAGPGQAPSVGIRLTGVRGVAVERNRVSANGYGITLTETRGSTLQGNWVGDNAVAGIVSFAGSDFNTVQDNVLRNADPIRALDPRADRPAPSFPAVTTAPSGPPPDDLAPIDCLDFTVGGGTAGTANLWWHNDGLTALPTGLCGAG
jgi:parallel beta-helix repeat protein